MSTPPARRWAWRGGAAALAALLATGTTAAAAASEGASVDPTDAHVAGEAAADIETDGDVETDADVAADADADVAGDVVLDADPDAENVDADVAADADAEVSVEADAYAAAEGAVVDEHDDELRAAIDAHLEVIVGADVTASLATYLDAADEATLVELEARLATGEVTTVTGLMSLFTELGMDAAADHLSALADEELRAAIDASLEIIVGADVTASLATYLDAADEATLVELEARLATGEVTTVTGLIALFAELGMDAAADHLIAAVVADGSNDDLVELVRVLVAGDIDAETRATITAVVQTLIDTDDDENLRLVLDLVLDATDLELIQAVFRGNTQALLDAGATAQLVAYVAVLADAGSPELTVAVQELLPLLIAADADADVAALLTALASSGDLDIAVAVVGDLLEELVAAGDVEGVLVLIAMLDGLDVDADAAAELELVLDQLLASLEAAVAAGTIDRAEVRVVLVALLDSERFGDLLRARFEAGTTTGIVTVVLAELLEQDTDGGTDGGTDTGTDTGTGTGTGTDTDTDTDTATGAEAGSDTDTTAGVRTGVRVDSEARTVAAVPTTGTLPVTGTSAAQLTLAGLIAAFLGAVALLGARRRREVLEASS